MKNKQVWIPPILAEPFVERVLFGNRLLVLSLFLLFSFFFAYQASKIQPDASLERMIPLEHAYIQNFLEHRHDLENLANFIRVSVAVKRGDIFTADYMETLNNINDELFYLPGVERAGLKSLWTPNVRWVEVTEDVFQGGPVIPNGYKGSPENLEQLRHNVLRSGQIGSLVANDFKSAIIYVPLLERDPETGASLDYKEFSKQLEQRIRDQFTGPNSLVNIHIIGFAKKIGDLIDGIDAVISFFSIAVLITAVLLFAYCRCYISTLVAVICSLTAVVWQLGLMHTLGYGLDPYSVLIPFIVFATAISHSVQFINGVHHDIAAGVNPINASMKTFRHHYLPAVLALISDAMGFLTLIFIEINVIQDLAVGASVGIASIIATNLILLPIAISYLSITKSGIKHVKKAEEHPSKIWDTFAKLSHPRYAFFVLLVTSAGVIAGLIVAKDVKIGELHQGAPELRPDSRYNKDNAFITSNYSTSADVMVVMVTTPPEKCISYDVMDAVDRVQWELKQAKGVQSAISIVDVSKRVTKAFNEGNLKWFELSRNQKIIDTSLQNVPSGFINTNCSLTPIFIFLDDHRAETLQRVVDIVEEFTTEYSNEGVNFLLAAGNAGIEVATNQVIKESQSSMIIVVYAVVAAMILFAYRSTRAIVCIIVPLGVTSVLCTALMTMLDIGIKVSTLPIIALGVGLGVDYGIYIFSRLEELLRQGIPLQRAYLQTLRSTGKAVAFTGLTLAIGTATWIFSPIKFQADMGILLTFMFLWNMVGAITLLPALAYFFIKNDAETKPKYAGR